MTLNPEALAALRRFWKEAALPGEPPEVFPETTLGSPFPVSIPVPVPKEFSTFFYSAQLDVIPNKDQKFILVSWNLRWAGTFSDSQRIDIGRLNRLPKTWSVWTPKKVFVYRINPN